MILTRLIIFSLKKNYEYEKYFLVKHFAPDSPENLAAQIIIMLFFKILLYYRNKYNYVR